MKKIFALTLVFIALPMSVFSSNSNIVGKNGIKIMVAQEPCGGG